jgi:hypothetical protein
MGPIANRYASPQGVMNSASGRENPFNLIRPRPISSRQLNL